jgi:hypothetical protein
MGPEVPAVPTRETAGAGLKAAHAGNNPPTDRRDRHELEVV